MDQRYLQWESSKVGPLPLRKIALQADPDNAFIVGGVNWYTNQMFVTVSYPPSPRDLRDETLRRKYTLDKYARESKQLSLS